MSTEWKSLIAQQGAQFSRESWPWVRKLDTDRRVRSFEAKKKKKGGGGNILSSPEERKISSTAGWMVISRIFGLGECWGHTGFCWAYGEPTGDDGVRPPLLRRCHARGSIMMPSEVCSTAPKLGGQVRVYHSHTGLLSVLEINTPVSRLWHILPPSWNILLLFT